MPRLDMQCPRCLEQLTIKPFKGIEVDRCQSCGGMWLDFEELDHLEDTVLDQDEIKGMLMYRQRSGDLSCPRCQGSLQVFNYRAYDLEIDFCENEHGFWLDAGEERRIRDLMKQRVKDLDQAAGAEMEWAAFLKRFKSRSFTDKLKGMFRR